MLLCLRLGLLDLGFDAGLLCTSDLRGYCGDDCYCGRLFDALGLPLVFV